MNRKTAVVTGATSGIGLATARALVSRNFRVIGIGRSDRNITRAAALFEETGQSDNIRYLKGDLSSRKEIHRLVDAIREQLGDEYALDVLINNAGSFASRFTPTADGIELQFAVNHLAPFLLTNLLLPDLKKSSDGRIITLSSSSHFGARIRWKDLQMTRRYSNLAAYRQSKFCNVLMTRYLDSRLKGRTSVRAFAADPGLVNTEIGLKGTNGLSRLVWSQRKKKGRTPEEGAATSVFLATDPDVTAHEEIYYKYCRPLKPDKGTFDTASMDRIWKISEELCGIAATI